MSAVKTVFCSFCGKSQHEVRVLITGPKVFICNECIALCVEIVAEHDDDGCDDWFRVEPSRAGARDPEQDPGASAAHVNPTAPASGGNGGAAAEVPAADEIAKSAGFAPQEVLRRTEVMLDAMQTASAHAAAPESINLRRARALAELSKSRVLPDAAVTSSESSPSKPPLRPAPAGRTLLAWIRTWL